MNVSAVKTESACRRSDSMVQDLVFVSRQEVTSVARSIDLQLRGYIEAVLQLLILGPKPDEFLNVSP